MSEKNTILTCSFCGRPRFKMQAGVECEHALICNYCISEAVAHVAVALRKEREQFKQQLKLKKAGE